MIEHFMGMYDNVDIAIGKLPLTPEERKKLKGHDWQTKDFDRTLTTIRVTDEDQLEILRTEYEPIPEEERTEPWKLLRVTGTHWEQLDYHGWFTFYGSVSDVWYEFGVKCTDGKVVKIDRLSPTTTITVEPEVKQISGKSEGR